MADSPRETFDFPARDSEITIHFCLRPTIIESTVVRRYRCLIKLAVEFASAARGRFACPRASHRDVSRLVAKIANRRSQLRRDECVSVLAKRRNFRSLRRGPNAVVIRTDCTRELINSSDGGQIYRAISFITFEILFRSPEVRRQARYLFPGW